MDIRAFDVEFTRDGAVFDPAQSEALKTAAGSFTHLVVFSHGWNNDRAEAAKLYDDFFASFGKLAKDPAVGLQERVKNLHIGVLRVFWPSKKFADADLIPGGGAAGLSAHDATAANKKALLDLLDRLQVSPKRLGDKTIDAERKVLVGMARAQLDTLDLPKSQEKFVDAIRSMLDHKAKHREDGSAEFFALGATDLFKRLMGSVEFVGTAAHGGATSLHDNGHGGEGGQAAGVLSDIADGALAAARRLVNFTTYYEMKNRAGVVGGGGLAALVTAIRERNAELPIIFIGHSFGARVVTAAAAKQASHGRGVSMLLLQAAFSHNSFSADFDMKGHEGGFRPVIALEKVPGPIAITHTKNDKAVGIAYPLASRIASQVASALGDENDPYGGLGRNGALFTREATAGELLEVGRPHAFANGRIHNLRADAFIKDHGDVTGAQVAWAFAHLL